ncbi:unnamed protein product [Cuscuta epithymum]|uniref:Uncharacterized protein n=1 Tax=Cuscuta epithymum TaxID=186058 RepID=A0AAV0C4T8_9ASTE|nr:unnamed protein product [Cuscuta epithymum]
MSVVNLTNVSVLDNPAPFLNPFQFEISYECLTSLKDDLEWKLIYVGSAEDETYDQLLESVLVGPVNVGKYRFLLQHYPFGFADWVQHTWNTFIHRQILQTRQKFVKKILLV